MTGEGTKEVQLALFYSIAYGARLKGTEVQGGCRGNDRGKKGWKDEGSLCCQWGATDQDNASLLVGWLFATRPSVTPYQLLGCLWHSLMGHYQHGRPP
jgi:hypothetical protein